MLTSRLRARSSMLKGPSLQKRLKRRFLYITPRYLRYLSQTVVVTPWAMGFVALYLLAFVPQMQEIYIGLIEDRDVARGLAGLISLAGFSALLYCWNHIMVTKRIDGIYPDHADIYFDRGVIGIRDLKTMISSALPFTGLCLGLLSAYFQVQNDALHIEQVSGAMGAGLDQADALKIKLETLPGAILFSFAFTALLLIALILLLHYSRNNRMWQKLFIVSSYVLTAVLVAVPILFSNDTLIVSRLAGPLASIGLVLIASAVFLRVLILIVAQILSLLLTLPSVVFMSMSGMPIALRQLIVVLIPMVPVFFIGARFVQTGQQAGKRPASIFEEVLDRIELTNKHRSVLAASFAKWLKARDIGATGEYPVFVVTTEGGGIYAASAASFFLAKMEESCPAFAEHVFGISAVSGGSVGASLFDAALSEQKQTKDPERAPGAVPAGCADLSQPGKLFERLRKITRDDHLSPVLAYILPDAVHDIREFFLGAPERKEPCNNEVPFEWFGRDQILEKSFISSFERSRGQHPAFGTVCPAAGVGNILMRNFSETWQADGKIPALLLNATWVETGYRVAFAPFPLEHLGEGTLYSFQEVSEFPGKGHDADPHWQNPSLIGAANVSARFPFVMPPWASNTHDKSRWTFVDGGYADSSGATTGLELYKELKKELRQSAELQHLTGASGKEIDPAQIKLHLILLTDSYVRPDFRKITGSSLDDVISPFSTLFAVRELLARRAVTRAYGELGKDVISIQLNQQTFPLSLGWQISGLSSDIIQFSMGRPDRCHSEKGFGEDWAVWTVNHNSCETKRIVELLTPKPAPPAPAQVTPPPAGTWQPQRQ